MLTTPRPQHATQARARATYRPSARARARAAWAITLPLVLAAIAPANSLAQRNPKNVVVVDATTEPNDTVGKLLVSDLLDDIARSPRWRQASAEQGPLGTTITIHIVTTAANANQTAVAEIMTANGMLLNDYVLTCGVNKIAECAHEIMPDLDHAVGLLK